MALVLIAASGFAQDSVYLDMRNATTIAGSPAKVQFDVYVKGNNAGTFFGSIISYLQFDETVFGTNPAIAVSKLSLLTGANGGAYTAAINRTGNVFNATVDNGLNLFGNPPANFIEMPTTYDPYVQVTIDYPSAVIVPTSISLLQDDSPPTPYDNGVYKVVGGGSPIGSAYAFGYATSTLSFGSLPVEWLSFTAKRKDDTRIQLKWETATETNNDYFVIQRSVDGELFENIGQVDGAGTSSEVSAYEFYDSNYPSSRLFYRIKQIDLSGQVQFSSIASVLIGDDAPKVAFFLYPSPAVDMVNAELLGETIDVYRLVIVDQMGRSVYDAEMDQENARLQIPVDRLANGIYNYQLTRGLDVVKQGRFLKVKQ